MKKVLKSIILPVVIVLGIIYIIVNVIKSSPKKIPAKSPVLTESPARVYGIVEPEGGEVYVSPPLTRQVAKIYVNERASVKKGQRLCRLENSVEKAQYEASLARVELAFKALELSRDKFERNKNLLANKAISEYEYKQLRLNLELDSLNLVAARREADLAKARLEQLDLKSPINGIVYKFDVKLGESFPAGDNSRIIIGKPGLWARLYVEAFWTDRVKIGDVYQIRNSETNQ
ncbi:MAG: efflux RND transporter periplasmic adaptor subunit, partial [bacterium]